MATSANALYVLRLVLGGVRRQPMGVRAFTQSASPPGYAEPPSFLESDEGEYAEAAEFLPDREPTTAPPVPWPTVFAHGAKRPHRAQPCDIVARLVASNKLGAARKVVDELAALHTPVQHRKIYLKPALASLEPSEEGRRNFLFWMGLYPARGATQNRVLYRREWEPLAHRILSENIDNPEFLVDFLELTGRKGLLNVFFPVFVLPLTAILAPHESEAAVARVIEAYRTACRPKSTSELGRTLASLVDVQTEFWWNKYLRALSIVGYRDSAHALLHSPPPGVRFHPWTRSMALGSSMTKERQAETAKAPVSRAALQRRRTKDPLWQILDNPAPKDRVLARHLARVLDRTQLDLPHVAELADTQRLLLLDRPELLEALEREFTAQDPNDPPNVDDPELLVRTSVRYQWWAHAEMLRHARAGEHYEAVRTFRRRFLWIGVPPTNIGGGGEPLTPGLRRVPNTRIICSLLPSILALQSPTERMAYRTAFYTQPRLCPSLKPNRYTNLAFVRAETYFGNPSAATEAIESLVELGQNPGVPAWTALLLSLMGRGDTDAALHLLGGMERQAPLGEGRRMPFPTGRTYAGLIRLAVNHGHTSVAADLLRRYRKFAENVGVDIESTETFFDHAKKRGRSAEEIAEDRRSQKAVTRELDRLEGDDLKPRIQMLFEMQRRKGGRGEEPKGVESAGEQVVPKGTAEKGEGKDAGEHGEEKKSAFA